MAKPKPIIEYTCFLPDFFEETRVKFSANSPKQAAESYVRTFGKDLETYFDRSKYVNGDMYKVMVTADDVWGAQCKIKDGRHKVVKVFLD